MPEGVGGISLWSSCEIFSSRVMVVILPSLVGPFSRGRKARPHGTISQDPDGAFSPWGSWSVARSEGGDKPRPYAGVQSGARGGVVAKTETLPL